MREPGLDTQQLKSIILLDIVATTVHFLLPLTQQCHMVGSAFIKGWFLALWSAYRLAGWLWAFWVALIRQSWCVRANRRLLWMAVGSGPNVDTSLAHGSAVRLYWKP